MTLIETRIGPGIHPNLPAAEYHALNYASAHRLSLLARSPLHMRNAIDHPDEQTPAMAIGEAVHCAVLEPGLFKTHYACAPDCDRRTKDGKTTWERFVAAHPGAKILKADDYDVCNGINNAVESHPAAMALLTDCEEIELSVVWKCRTTGVGCKLRADGVRRDLGVVFDLKTCEDASRTAFERSIFNFNYARQAAHYLRGLNAAGIGVDGFVFIAVEKAPPHDLCVYRLDDEVIAAADEEVMRLLELYGKCEREQSWPGYETSVVNIRVPRWAEREMGIQL